MARDIPEDMRRTVKVQLRLTPEAAEALQVKPVGKKSEWVSKLILDAARKAWVAQGEEGMNYDEKQRLLHLCTEVYDRGGDCLSENETQELALLARTALGELDEANRYADACAHAIGVEYEADGHPTVRGPLEAVVQHIKDAVRDAGELIDVRNSLRITEGMYISVRDQRDALKCPDCGRLACDGGAQDCAAYLRSIQS